MRNVVRYLLEWCCIQRLTRRLKTIVDAPHAEAVMAIRGNQLFCVSNIFRTAGGIKIPSRLSLRSDFARTRIFLRLESFLLMRIMGFPETRQYPPSLLMPPIPRFSYLRLDSKAIGDLFEMLQQ